MPLFFEVTAPITLYSLRVTWFGAVRSRVPIRLEILLEWRSRMSGRTSRFAQTEADRADQAMFLISSRDRAGQAVRTGCLAATQKRKKAHRGGLAGLTGH